MLSFSGGPQVVPAPVTNNQNPITCRHAAFQKPPQPAGERKGVATAEFLNGKASASRIREIVDIIADPKKSHFFNTDCVSCHTDTAQPLNASARNSPSPASRRRCCRKKTGTSAISAGSPRSSGWPAVPTVTRRTATETAEVVEFINRELLDK